jgi:hypothetical protein
MYLEILGPFYKTHVLVQDQKIVRLTIQEKITVSQQQKAFIIIKKTKSNFHSMLRIVFQYHKKEYYYKCPTTIYKYQVWKPPNCTQSFKDLKLAINKKSECLLLFTNCKSNHSEDKFKFISPLCSFLKYKIYLSFKLFYYLSYKYTS